MNLLSTIIPKSDQLNSDDLIAGPRIIKITSVESGGAEQPVSIHYEGEHGRPYKPSKSMRRVLVAIWGADGDAYVGRSLNLYRDPNIKFGGDPVGGIRISHASDITESVSMALTETRGRRKQFRVEPLVSGMTNEAPDIQVLTDLGDTKAKGGTEALKTWWGGIQVCPAKTELGKTKLPEWKTIAADADARNRA
jgi:hypothetical protein